MFRCYYKIKNYEVDIIDKKLVEGDSKMSEKTDLEKALNGVAKIKEEFLDNRMVFYGVESMMRLQRTSLIGYFI